MRVLSVGEVLWDVIDDRTFLGGAPLNVCANLRRCGDQAILVSGVGQDSLGSAAIVEIEKLGLSTSFIEIVPRFATGTAVVSRDASGEPRFGIDRPVAFDAFTLPASKKEAVVRLSPDWIYMGTLLQTAPEMEHLLQTIRMALPGARCFYDLNLREGHWNLALVERLCERVCILKLNESEAATLARLTGGNSREFDLESFCRMWSKRFGIDVICVTLGPEGCCVLAEETFAKFGGRLVTVRDTVGAGDAFAAAFLHGYHQRWSIARCAGFANALGALVASRVGATPDWSMSELVL